MCKFCILSPPSSFVKRECSLARNSPNIYCKRSISPTPSQVVNYDNIGTNKQGIKVPVFIHYIYLLLLLFCENLSPNFSKTLRGPLYFFYAPFAPPPPPPPPPPPTFAAWAFAVVIGCMEEGGGWADMVLAPYVMLFLCVFLKLIELRD